MNGTEMIPCDQVIVKLWEYIDGELGDDTASMVQAHLEMCALCFPQYDFQRAYKEFLLRTAQQEVPPGLKSKIFEAILKEETLPTANGGGHGLGGRLRGVWNRLLQRGGE